MGSTEDDSDEYEHAGRRVTGKLSAAVNSGSGNVVQPRRISGKTEAASWQWRTPEKRHHHQQQQQQRQRPKQRSLDELLPLFPERYGAASFYDMYGMYTACTWFIVPQRT